MPRLTTRTDEQAAYAHMVHVEQLARRDRRRRSRRGGLADPRNGWLALAAAVGVLLLVQALVSVMA